MLHKYFTKVFLNRPTWKLPYTNPQCRYVGTTTKTETIQFCGYPVHYITVGNGPHVVFCFPGILGNMKIHTVSQIKNFDRSLFTFVTFDQPGYGKSSPPERELHDASLEEDTEIMEKLMSILGFKEYSLMGWSGGGCSALLAAVRNPDIVKKLVLWGTFAKVEEDDAKIFKDFEERENQQGKMMEILVDEYGKDFFGKHFGGWMRIFRRIHSHKNGRLVTDKELRGIKCPTLILHGTEDGLVKPKHGEHLNENITNSRLVKWKGGKHNLHLRYPKEFNETVQQFLQE